MGKNSTNGPKDAGKANKYQGHSHNNGKNNENNYPKKDRNSEKEQELEQKKLFVQNMTNFSLPITDKKETFGKTVLGAYVNVAQDNFSKTILYIFGKIGLTVKGTNYVKLLTKILEAYRTEAEWKANNPGLKKPGPKNKHLLLPEQNEKLRVLLFHHFSVLAPILGSMKNTEIANLSKEIDKNEENKSLSEDNAKEIIKKVKEIVKSAQIDDCLQVLICLATALEQCRNYYSHYRAYNNRDNQTAMFKVYANTAIYLTNAFKASALICKSNAGKNAKQYELITGEYHYKKEKGRKKEYTNYYYYINGQSNVVKTNDEIESETKYNSISDFGLVYLVSLFLAKSDTEMMLEKLGVFDRSPFKDLFEMEKAVLTSTMAVYRINIPKGRRLKMEDDNVQLCMDMLNELQKCPQELYDVITQEGKDSFKREQTEPKIDAETGEYVREKFVKSEKGQKRQQKVESTDGTGNIVYQGKGVYSLLVRKEDRFPYFALRYIDNRNLFTTIRFQIDLGYYRFAFFPKIRIDDSEATRILQKRINGFGKLVYTENERLEKWENLFQKSEMRNPNETDKAEIARDEEGNIIEIEQLIKADAGTEPFVTDKRASYNFHTNRIGLYWDQSSDANIEPEPYVPDLKTKVNAKKKVRPDVDVITPLASLSVHDLPALIFYEYLREGKGKMSAEKIIKDKYKLYKEFFQDIADGKINSWNDVKKTLKKKDIPEKFWPFLDNRNSGDQTGRIVGNYVGKDIEDGTNKYHFIGHIQERIDYLEREIKKFNDICLKMVTTDNEYGTDDYKAFRPASLARKMARSVMEWLPADCPAKKIMTGVNYSVMTSVLSQFGSDSNDIKSIRSMFVKGEILASEDTRVVKDVFHPFLKDVLNTPIRNMESLYFEYISKELEYVKKLGSELEDNVDKRGFIQMRLPFTKLARKRFADRDDKYYRRLARRYLNIDNSENDGDFNEPAIILLPDGLFTEYVFKLLQAKYPDIFTGIAGEGVNNNASYLISTYFDKVCHDESQRFYQCFKWGQRKADPMFMRHYKFFDFYDDPKLRENNNSDNSKDRKTKRIPFESKLSLQEINEKLNTIDKEAIRKKVEEYIQFEKAKLKSYCQDEENYRSLLINKENKDFLVKKDEKIVRLERKLKKLDQMILNSKQKIVRISETYFDKFISLKNECQRKEKTIRRYRIEDIVTFFMVSSYFNEIFKDKEQVTEFRLQDVGRTTNVEDSDNEESFLDKTVPFSRIIPVTFARDEEKMFAKEWNKNDENENVTINCEVFLDRIAIRHYNLTLAELNDERLLSFLTHFASISYLYRYANPDTPLCIDYNRLSLEFKMYNQLRPDIFKEVHAIEKIIVDNNTLILNDENHPDFFIPLKKNDLAKLEKGEQVVREDKDARRNSFVNLLALVYEESNRTSQYTNNVRKSAAHNHYGILFKELAEEDLLRKIIRAYVLLDKLPEEIRQLDKGKDLHKSDPHSFAALILNKIRQIRELVEKELKEKYSKN